MPTRRKFYAAVGWKDDIKGQVNMTDNGELRVSKEPYEDYYRELAEANGVPEQMIGLLEMIETGCSELREQLSRVENEAGMVGLENKDGKTFSQVVWDYVSQHSLVPVEHLIGILGQFYRRASKDRQE
jgi:hypothetical protein